MFQNLQCYESRVYHILLALQCVYGCSDERDENGNGDDESEISVVGEAFCMQMT